MANCHKCGCQIPKRTGVYKVMKTGKYTGGSDYFRNVNLCDKCAQTLDTEAEGKKKQKTILMVVVVAVVAILAIYWFMQNR